MNSITINASNVADSKINIQQLKQSEFNHDEYELLMDKTKGSLTISYGDDVDGIFLIANNGLSINKTQQVILNYFQEYFNSIEKVIDPERLKFNLSEALDGEICINRKSTTGGRVKIIIHDDGLVALSFVSDNSRNGQDILDFFSADSIDYEQLSYRFFSL